MYEIFHPQTYSLVPKHILIPPQLLQVRFALLLNIKISDLNKSGINGSICSSTIQGI